ncbi:MAG: hypothetical protein H7301_05545 [Cryobacterium sp.]|nr:hypothetical protein [Oligoflexia bacterium]
MKLLVVGAGAVGSVYGYLAGLISDSAETCEVTFLVKPQHRKNLEKGLNLYQWRGKIAAPLLFKNYSIIDSLKELKRISLMKSFDAVLITLPSDKVAADGWLTELFESSGTAKIWSLQPNLKDREFILNAGKSVFGSEFENRVVWGRIPMMSYLAPLPGEDFTESGYAFYIPPGAKAAWSCSHLPNAEKVADFYNSHGLPSKAVKDFVGESIFSEAFLRGLVAGLEKSEWSFSKLMNGINLPLVTESIREMTAIQSQALGLTDPGRKWWARAATSRSGIKNALRLARLFIPFDLEAFFRVHFTKVETQMHSGIQECISMGKAQGQSTTNLTLLKGRAHKSKLDTACISTPLC